MDHDVVTPAVFAAVLALAGASIVAGALTVSARGGRPIAHAALVCAALLALTVQAAVAPRGGAWDGARFGALRGPRALARRRNGGRGVKTAEGFVDTAAAASSPPAQQPPLDAANAAAPSGTAAASTSTAAPPIAATPAPAAASATSISSNVLPPSPPSIGLVLWGTSLDPACYPSPGDASGRLLSASPPQPPPHVLSASTPPPASSSSASSSSSCGTGAPAPVLTFLRAPAWTRGGGFVLGDNTLSGPQCHQLGVDGSGAFSFALAFQPRARAPVVPTSASVLRLFANNGDGLEVTAFSAEGGRPPSLALSVGAAGPFLLLRGDDAPLDPQRRYLLVVTKGAAAASATLVDLDAAPGGSPALQPLLLPGDAQLSPADALLRLANVEMTVNGGAGGWDVGLLALALWSRAVSDADVLALAQSLAQSLRALDPAWQAAQADAAQAATRTLRACPFDAATCAACGGVADWTVAAEAAVLGGDAACLRAIDRFCVANPQHPRCTCWDLSNPAYATSCSAYRALYSGDTSASCAGQTQALAQAQALIRSQSQALAQQQQQNDNDGRHGDGCGCDACVTEHRKPAHSHGPGCGCPACSRPPPAHDHGHGPACGCDVCARRRRADSSDGDSDSDSDRDSDSDDGNGDGEASRPGFWSWLFGGGGSR